MFTLFTNRENENRTMADGSHYVRVLANNPVLTLGIIP
jgi:hypothetical protein